MPDEKQDCQCERTCDNCSECQDCGSCACVTCPNCNKKVNALCSRCGRCSEHDCCECVFCEHLRCGQPFESVCSDCNMCGNHCECIHCSHCNALQEYTCGRCDRGTDCGCCECVSCESCGESVGHTCGECNRCPDCCECEHGPRQAQRFTIKKPINAKGYKENASKRPVSIELELCSVANDTALIAWAKKTGAGLVEDGSLQELGVEINTNPASGDYFVQDARMLATALKDCGANVDKTCGLHVHVDASDFTQFDIRRLILLWTVVERSMFDLAGKNRIDNTYCKPCAATYANIYTQNPQEWRKQLAECLYRVADKNTYKAKQAKYQDARYYALNIHSYFFRKTFEFRLHEARTDAHVLENWPLLCGRLVDVSMRTPERELLGMVKSTRNSEDVLTSILPAHLASWTGERLAERREARKQAGTYQETENALNALENGRDIIACAGQVKLFQNSEVQELF